MDAASFERKHNKLKDSSSGESTRSRYEATKIRTPRSDVTLTHQTAVRRCGEQSENLENSSHNSMDHPSGDDIQLVYVIELVAAESQKRDRLSLCKVHRQRVNEL